VAIGLIATNMLTVRASSAERTALAKSDVTPGLAQSVRLGHRDASLTLKLAVSLALRNEAALDRFLAGVSDPASRLYGRHLTPTAFAALYGPTQAQVDQVVQHLRTSGLSVTSVSPNRTIVDATGPVRAVETAFGVTISDWHDAAENRDFFGNDSQPVLPASLAPLVVGVSGLNNHYRARHHAVASLAASTPVAGAYNPTDLKTAYNVVPLAARGFNGAGQPLGLFELDVFKRSNISTYDAQYGLSTTPPSVVSIDGGPLPAGGEVEVELDIEVMHAIAPSSPITVWAGPNTDAGAIDTYNAMVTSNTTPANSTSWGQCEPSSTAGIMATLDNIFKQAAAQGQSFYAASGDTGAYDCKSNPSSSFTGLAVDSPANDPFITAVGGTTLHLGAASSYSSESAWSDRTRSPQLGSGGGLSVIFPRPSWQTGPGVANAFSTSMRQVPDVALDADPTTGYSIYATDKGTTGWFVIGGTSAAAPAWAAFTSLLNQVRAAYDAPRFGFANPLLYGLGSTTPPYSPFHDTSTGDNLYYSSTVGWDYATGWGSFDAYNLARDASGARLPALSVLGQPALRNRTTPPSVPQSPTMSHSLVAVPTAQLASASPSSAGRATAPAIQDVFAGLQELARLLGGS
jgi:subtilase family serine protease